MTSSKVFLYFCLFFILGIFLNSLFLLSQLTMLGLFILGTFLISLFLLKRDKKLVALGFCLILIGIGAFCSENILKFEIEVEV